jgi:hypothetical protein
MARIPASAAADVQHSFRDMWAEIDRLKGVSGLNTDLHGRRLINAGDAVDTTDYVTKRQLDAKAEANIGDNLDVRRLTVRELALVLGTVLMPRFTDGTKHFALLFVDNSGKVNINEDGEFALDLNLDPTEGWLELGYNLKIKWFSGPSIGSPADAIVVLRDHAGTSFNRLSFGGTTASFPAWQRSGAEFIARLADDSANAKINVAKIDSDQKIRVLGSDGFQGDKFVVNSAPAYTITNVTTDRAYDANATTLDELADVLGTLLSDLHNAGIVG